MPTIHREAGFRFSFFSNDHPPPHVHVTDSEGAMKVLLGDETSSPSIYSISGMKEASVRLAFQIVVRNQATFLEKWRQWHG